MSSILLKITDSVIKSSDITLKRISDTELKGFHVRLGKIKPSGDRAGSFYLYYRLGGRGGIERNYKIGDVGAFSSLEARKEAKKLIGEIAKGNDIKSKKEKKIDNVKQHEKSDDVAVLMNVFIEKFIKTERKRPDDPIRMINVDIIPSIGKVKLSELDTKEIITQCIDPIVNRGSKVYAGRVFSLLKQAFQFGVHRGLIQISPLNNTKKRNITGKELAKDRFLTEDELKIFFDNLPKARITRPVQIALTLLCLTGCRVNEMIIAEWEHINFDTNIWFFPPENTKSHKGKEKPHHVPLNPTIIKYLKELELQFSYLDSKYIFPSVSKRNVEAGAEPMKSRSMSQAVARHTEYFGIDKFTPHDFRRTVQTQMAKMGVDAIVIEKVLNHELAGMMRIYNQYDYMEERRSALEQWSVKLNKLIGSNTNV